MKRLDRLILSEMIGPWAFGVAIFTVLIMAGSFLFELTRYITDGINPLLVGQLTALLMPGIMVKTFPMAVLLSGLLSFGRLSGDSEIVALKAAGVSVGRIMWPVAAFGLAVSFLTFCTNEQVVPLTTQEAVGLKKRFEADLKGKTAQEMSQAVYKDGKLVASFWAADFDFSKRTLSRVIVTVYGSDQLPTYYIFVEELEYTSEKRWVVRGGGSMTSADAKSLVKFGSAQPTEMPDLDATPEELLAKALRDLDALPMKEMGRQIEKLRKSPDMTAGLRSQIANLEFGYWNKIALPLAALVFSLVGAPLGIRSHRVPASAGFWQAVIIILAYLVLANVMSISAQGGRVPAFAASFLPIVIGLTLAGYLVHRRNT
ncbi:MAG: LptF/LptG family permease [Armatimonadetes bacterium]|nr:LptF/LptG family permease [Armatimonadota bacterium]